MENSVFPADRLGQFDTPCYYYDMKLLSDTLDAVEAELAAMERSCEVHYAVKANANRRLLQTIAQRGWGADCVSGGEIEIAAEAGFKADRIVFAGVGKADWEIEKALKLGIECFNVESVAELHVIEEIAERLKVKANIAFRVNPNVRAHTHAKITTGMAENKFGIAVEQLDEAIADCTGSPWLEWKGLHFHIGSQILDMGDFRDLCLRVDEILERLSNKGYVPEIINVGGGLGVDYDNPDKNPIPDFRSYFGTFHKYLNLSDRQTLHFELGRSIVAQCGTLLARVLYIKEGVHKNFVVLDAGMTELIRPAMYHAVHKIENLTGKGSEKVYDVVGPVCESSDTFAKDMRLPETARGDLIAVRSAGAYGESMALAYNGRRGVNVCYSDKI